MRKCEHWALRVSVIGLAAAATAAPQRSALGQSDLGERSSVQRIERLSLTGAEGRLTPLLGPEAASAPKFSFVIHRPVPTPEGITAPRPLMPNPSKRQTCVDLAQDALVVWNRPSDPRRPAAIAAHTSACMLAALLGGTVGVVDTGIVRKAIGAIAWMDGATATVFCTGLLLSPRTVVTARHCFGQPQGDSQMGFDPQAGLAACALSTEGCRLAFLPAVEPGTPIPITGPAQGVQGQIARSDDHFVVRLATEMAESPEVRFVAPVETQGLLVVGPDLREPNPLGKSVTLRWLRGADFLPCGIVAVGTSTMTHTCQTAPAFSGAPLITEAGRSDNGGERISVAGLHLGGAEPRDEEFRGPSITQPGWSNTEVLNIALNGDVIAERTKIQ